MACKQATPQQLAYLGELKQRLKEMRKRQKVFMEETAEILRKIKTDHSGRTTAVSRVPSQEMLHRADHRFVAEPDTESLSFGAEQISRRECAGKIKQLVQRFENLSQTSGQFSEQPMLEELAAVDVRKLLLGYEKLIESGNVLQKSWLLLKTTTEKCALQNLADDSQLNTTSPKLASSSEHSSDGPSMGLTRVPSESRNESATQQVLNDLADCEAYG